MTTRLAYEYSNDARRATHPDGRTLIFPRSGGVWLVTQPDALESDGQQIEGELDFRAGRNTPRSKARAAKYAREFFTANPSDDQE